jgi:hypothetical protein
VYPRRSTRAENLGLSIAGAARCGGPSVVARKAGMAVRSPDSSTVAARRPRVSATAASTRPETARSPPELLTRGARRCGRASVLVRSSSAVNAFTVPRRPGGGTRRFGRRGSFLGGRARQRSAARSDCPDRTTSKLCCRSLKMLAPRVLQLCGCLCHRFFAVSKNETELTRVWIRPRAAVFVGLKAETTVSSRATALTLAQDLEYDRLVFLTEVVRARR